MKLEDEIAIKQDLENFIKGTMGKSFNRDGFTNCINPSHEDNKPSASIHYKAKIDGQTIPLLHCFSCTGNKQNYDTFDAIQFYYGLNSRAEAYKKGAELYNVEHLSNVIYQEEGQNYKSYYEECENNIDKTDYLQSRGIGEDIIKRAGIGYDEQKKAVIIPNGEYSYIERFTDPQSSIRYKKHGTSQLYLSQLLMGYLEIDKPIFIVEGELDALSIMEAGGLAVALGTTTNTGKLLDLLKKNKPDQPLLLALDNDKSGIEATNSLSEELDKLHIEYYKINVYGKYKDANEALQQDREDFIKSVDRINQSQNLKEYVKELEIDEYKKTSTANYIDSFMQKIAMKKKIYSTGFNQLDTLLDGGLHDGLYTIGAVSSLGKTTLMLQMMDHIASTGEDVMIFSLEMARSELMAKSISRETVIEAIKNNIETSNAKTTRGITIGERYKGYSEQERNLIKRAFEKYKEYAYNIYIKEGIGMITTNVIREDVQRHVDITGRKPVILIDYLQLIAPRSDRMNEKQAIDNAVMELKRISRDFDIPVIVVSSLNRASYEFPVTMKSFKETGGIEYSSDVLMGLHYKGVGKDNFNYKEAREQDPVKIELVMLKNRNGKSEGTIDLEFYPYFNYFKEC